MSADRGIVLLLFDIPMSTAREKKVYRNMRKLLRENGFFPLQASVYAKLLRHFSGCRKEMEKMRGLLPTVGKIILLPMQCKQFREMCVVSGVMPDMDLYIEDYIVL